jgi:hypothetical protein
MMVFQDDKEAPGFDEKFEMEFMSILMEYDAQDPKFSKFSPDRYKVFFNI